MELVSPLGLELVRMLNRGELDRLRRSLAHFAEYPELHAAAALFHRHVAPPDAAEFLHEMSHDDVAAKMQLNHWAEDKTNGLIAVAPMDVLADTLLVFMSALALDDKWAFPANEGRNDGVWWANLSHAKVTERPGGGVCKVELNLRGGCSMTLSKGEKLTLAEYGEVWPEMTATSPFVMNVTKAEQPGADIILPVVREQVTTMVEGVGGDALAQTCMLTSSPTFRWGRKSTRCSCTAALRARLGHRRQLRTCDGGAEFTCSQAVYRLRHVARS